MPLRNIKPCSLDRATVGSSIWVHVLSYNRYINERSSNDRQPLFKMSWLSSFYCLPSLCKQIKNKKTILPFACSVRTSHLAKLLYRIFKPWTPLLPHRQVDIRLKASGLQLTCFELIDDGACLAYRCQKSTHEN